MIKLKNLKKVIAVVLCIVTVFSCFSICAYAANVSDSLGHNVPENSGDWAKYKSKRSSSTTKDEVKWMQKAINYCIDNRGLTGISKKLSVDGDFGALSRDATKTFQKAVNTAIANKKLSISKLDVDGSFGPATIKAMKTVLNNGDKNTLKATSSNSLTTNSTTVNNGKITTEMIKAVCDKYGYTSDKYWTMKTNTSYPNYSNCAKSNYKDKDCYASSIPQGNKDKNGNKYMSYNYNNTWECCGFASYIMYKVTGKELKAGSSSATAQNGWKVYKSTSAAGSLKVGDIIRYNGHSAIVYTVDSKGNATFVECWGSKDCVIKINSGFNKSTGTRTLSYFNNSKLKYIYRYEG